MRGAGFGMAGYRVRATFRRRRASYLALVVPVGLIGGLGLAAARRTQASFSPLLGSTNPSNVSISVYGGQPGGSSEPDYDASLTAATSRLPYVPVSCAAATTSGWNVSGNVSATMTQSQSSSYRPSEQPSVTT